MHEFKEKKNPFSRGQPGDDVPNKLQKNIKIVKHEFISGLRSKHLEISPSLRFLADYKLRSFSEATVCPKGLGCWPLVSTLSLLYWVYLSISYLCLFCFCVFL